MPDKFEREIEEILAKLDSDAPSGERKPISIKSARRKSPAKPQAQRTARRLPAITPTTLLFSGAGIMIGGLLLSGFWEPFIWASFGGIVLFLAAFLWSFKRSPRAVGGASAPQGHYWRDRYIEYQPTEATAWDRMKRRFRRR
jgi:hypothetical protein